MDDIATLQIRVLSNEVDLASRRLADLERQGEGTERSVRRLGASSKLSFGAIAAGVTSVIGVSAATGAAVHQWLAYDKAMKEVLSISTMSRTEFKAMRGDILDLATTMGVDATVAAKGLYQALSAGIPKESALEFMKVAGKAAIGGVTSVNVAVDGLTNVINAYKLPVSEAAVITDKLFAAVVDGKTTFEELSSYMSKTTVTAAAMGVPLEQVLASIVAITQQGTKTPEAFTQITAALKALLDPADEMIIAFKDMGVESGRQAVAQHGLAGALQLVRDRFEGNDTALVKAMRGTEAYNAILSMTGENLKLYDKGLKSVEDSAGKTNKAFVDNANTLETAIAGLKSTFVGFVESLENGFGPIQTATNLLKEMTSAIGSMKNAGNEAATAANKIGGVGGAIALQNEIAKLEAEREALRATQAGTGLSEFEAMGGFGGTKDIDAITERINRAREAMNGFSVETIETARAYDALRVATEAGDEAGITSARERITSLEAYQQRVTSVADAEKAAAEESVKVRLAKVAEADKQLALEKEAAEVKAKADKEAKQAMDSLVKDAERLSTTERERLELQIKNMEALKAQRPEMTATADEAIAALKKQVAEYDKLYDANGNRIKKALAVEEDTLKDSLDRQKDLRIGYAEDIARSEYEIALEAQQKVATAIQQSLIGQHQFTLTAFSDFFGNLSQLSSFHSEKAFKVAQAFSIAQATIKMFESAVAAYAQGSAISPFLGPVFASAALAAGASNIASIKSQKYQAYELGGMIPAGQYGLVGEAGPEFVRGPAMITSARATKGQQEGRNRDEKNFRIVINNVPGHTADVTESTDQEGAIVEITITKTIERLTAEAINGGGQFVPALASRFNLRRNANAR